jgi:thiosulfate/3-mercaptopyruvate sulfurtransferase
MPEALGPLVGVDTLARHLDDPGWVVVDARFSLADPAAGERAYRAGHVPGAVYAHLDRDLSGPVVPGRTGRHPLPDPERLAATFGRLGIGPDSRVVAYDDAGGGLAAARVWWLLDWLGHEAAAVLDGGWAAWTAAGLPTRAGDEQRAARTFVGLPRPARLADAAAVAALAQDPRGRVLDARSAERFRGENETIDPVAGRIPGARSAPYTENLGPDGRFLPPAALADRYRQLLGDVEPGRVAAYCGSGVTAAQELLALRLAGFGAARLYAGSWSEWITDPARPVARGPA